MASTNEPADPIAKGILPTAKQSLSDLFKWKQRTVVNNDFGEQGVEWQQPIPFQNPFGLMAQLNAQDVSFFSCPNKLPHAEQAEKIREFGCSRCG
jgi:hypothetical protein